MGKIIDNLRIFGDKDLKHKSKKSKDAPGRSSSGKSLYSLVPISEVTPGALEVWLDLPEEIRNDPVLGPFREQYEKQHGVTPTTSTKREDGSNQLENGARKPSHTTLVHLGAEDKDAPKSKMAFSASKVHPDDSAKVHNVRSPHSEAHEDETDAEEKHKWHKWFSGIKIGCLLAVWLTFSVILVLKNERVELIKHIAVPIGQSKGLIIGARDTGRIQLMVSGPFVSDAEPNATASRRMEVWLERVRLRGDFQEGNFTGLSEDDVLDKERIAEVWTLSLVTEDQLDVAAREKKDLLFLIPDQTNATLNSTHYIRANFKTNLNDIIPLEVEYNLNPINIDSGVIYAAIILALLYILIIFEIVHRTFAAILGSTLAIAVLALLEQRPSMEELVSWIDIETLLLLFSMMVLVAILAETGVFDFLAVYAYKVTGGRIWPLINCLCLFTALLSSFLDNVTTVLLMTPVTIRLCEVMELNPVPILMAMVIYSNVGGTATPVGDPPNVIIASNSEVIAAGVNFTNFTLHVGLGILLVGLQTYFQLRYMYRNMSTLRFSEPQDIIDLKREVHAWKRAEASLSNFSKDEDVVKSRLHKKVKKLNQELKKKQSGIVSKDVLYRQNLREMMLKYPIRDRVLLVKAAISVLIVVVVFFLHSIPELKRLSLGWTALLGSILLLILADREDLEPVIARVEWTTLLFFAALFVLMEALSKLGLIAWIGHQTERVILSVSEGSQLTVAILLLLWVSALASAFVDNIPLTTMMIRVVTSLGNNPTLNLPMQPLIWALAFGACLGGNGTLIGASANVVCAGVAEQHGYRFTFVQFFKVGFPLMLGSIVTCTVYLLFCHVVLAWH